MFTLCLKYDSFKIGLQIYLRYLTPVDITPGVCDLFINSVRDSTKFHEVKLFFVHEYFEVLSIAQMNRLLDIY